MAEGSQQECLLYITELVKGEMEKGEPSLVPISVALGALESALTDKRRQQWPANLQVRLSSMLAQGLIWISASSKSAKPSEPRACVTGAGAKRICAL